MTIAAALRFSQGATVGTAGRAFMGVTGSVVTLANGDDTNVVKWTYTLLEVPEESGLTPGVLSTGASPTTTFTPDVAYGYRVQVDVEDAGGYVASDIRVFGVPDSSDWFLPPYNAVPKELNFGGQGLGWAGTVASKMLNKILRDISAFIASGGNAGTNGLPFDGSPPTSWPALAGSGDGVSASWLPLSDFPSIIGGGIAKVGLGAITAHMAAMSTISLPDGPYSIGNSDGATGENLPLPIVISGTTVNNYLRAGGGNGLVFTTTATGAVEFRIDLDQYSAAGDADIPPEADLLDFELWLHVSVFSHVSSDDAIFLREVCMTGGAVPTEVAVGGAYGFDHTLNAYYVATSGINSADLGPVECGGSAPFDVVYFSRRRGQYSLGFGAWTAGDFPLRANLKFLDVGPMRPSVRRTLFDGAFDAGAFVGKRYLAVGVDATMAGGETSVFYLHDMTLRLFGC